MTSVNGHPPIPPGALTSGSFRTDQQALARLGEADPTELEAALKVLGPRATRVDISHVITRDDQRIERNVTIECGEVAR
jgi:hypothetical protein